MARAGFLLNFTTAPFFQPHPNTKIITTNTPHSRSPTHCCLTSDPNRTLDQSNKTQPFRPLTTPAIKMPCANCPGDCSGNCSGGCSCSGSGCGGSGTNTTSGDQK